MVRKRIAAAAAVGALTGGTLGFITTDAFATSSGTSTTPVAGSTAGGSTNASTKPTPAQRRAQKQAAMLAKRNDKMIRSGLIGKVVSDSSTGGAFAQGQLVIAQPDGSTFTFALTNRSRAFMVQGLGKPAVKESPGTIPAGQVVIVRGAQIENGVWWAPTIRESGFTAS